MCGASSTSGDRNAAHFELHAAHNSQTNILVVALALGAIEVCFSGLPL